MAVALLSTCFEATDPQPRFRYSIDERDDSAVSTSALDDASSQLGKGWAELGLVFALLSPKDLGICQVRYVHVHA